MKQSALALTLLAGFASAASAQGVDDLNWFWQDGELLLQNRTSAAISFDGYTLACEAGCLDPDGWRTMPEAVAEDAGVVIASLGIGALSMGPAGTPSGNQLSELNLAGAATLQPGASWSFGRPINGTFTEVSQWNSSGVLTATMSGSGRVISAPLFFPEPGSFALASLCAVSLIGFRALRRRRAEALSV